MLHGGSGQTSPGGRDCFRESLEEATQRLQGPSGGAEWLALTWPDNSSRYEWHERG
jgi:hypothetical protein